MKLFLVLFMLLSSTSALADIAPGWFKHKDTITKASIAAEVDAGMLASFAASIADLNLGFVLESLEPNLAATVISFESLENILDFQIYII